jgi:hypothetical protein
VRTTGDTRSTRVNRNVEDEAAAGAATREGCTEATLRGTYLTAYDGVGTGGPEEGPFAAAELEWYDGKGNIRGVGSSNSNGTISSKGKFSGTYTVNADCTGTSTYPGDGFEYKYDLFIAPDGSMFTFVQTSPTESVASGVEQRVTRKRVGD